MEQYHLRAHFLDAATLAAMSDEKLAQALSVWQHTLEHFQGCAVDTAMDLGRLKGEQARRERLREICDPKAGETPQSEPTQEGVRILSFVRSPKEAQ